MISGGFLGVRRQTTSDMDEPLPFFSRGEGVDEPVTLFSRTPTVKDYEIATGAASCHASIHDWLRKEKPTGRKKWRGDLIKMLVRHTVMKTAEWRDVFKSGAEKLKDKYPHQAAEIDKTVIRYLAKSPVEGFLTAEAYKWLQYLENNRPQGSWYPRLAVEVAHKVFRLKGKIATFRKYLDYAGRRQTLESIFCVGVAPAPSGMSMSSRSLNPTKRKSMDSAMVPMYMQKKTKASNVNDERQINSMLTPTPISSATASAATTGDNARATHWHCGLRVHVGKWSKRSPHTWTGTITDGPAKLKGEDHFLVQPTGAGVPGWFGKSQLIPDLGASASSLPDEENLDSDGEGNEGEGEDASPEKDLSTPDNNNTGHGSGNSDKDFFDFFSGDTFYGDFEFSDSACNALTEVTDLLEEIFSSDDFAYHVDQCAAQVLGEVDMGIKVVESGQPVAKPEETGLATTTLRCHATNQRVATLDDDKHNVSFRDLGAPDPAKAVEHSNGEDTTASNVATLSSASTNKNESGIGKTSDALVSQLLQALLDKDKEIKYLRGREKRFESVVQNRSLQQLQARVEELEQKNQKLEASVRLNRLRGDKRMRHRDVAPTHRRYHYELSDSSSPKSTSPRSSLSSERSRSHSSSAQSSNEAEFDMPVLQPICLPPPELPSDSKSSKDGSDGLMRQLRQSPPPLPPLPRPDSLIPEALPIYLEQFMYGHDEPTEVELSPLFIDGIDSVRRARELLNTPENQAALGDHDTVVVYSKRMGDHYVITKGVDGIWRQVAVHRSSCAPELDLCHLDRVTLLES